MQLFFVPNTESDFYTLSEEESRHCVKVLRLAAGDHISVTDGGGTLCRCSIVEAHPKHCLLKVEERISDYEMHSFRLHVALAPTKNTARIEWFVEKAVEMGIDEITPIICDHSERCVLRQERLQKVAVSALKQSLKSFMPVINPPTPFSEVIDTPFDGERFMAYCDGDHRTPLNECYHPGQNALILIGPEGDFSLTEINHALNAGFKPVTLGQYRLRTETAALAATAYFNLMN